MAELLKILRVYVILAGFTLVGIVAYRVTATYRWMRIPEDFSLMSPLLQVGQVFRINKPVVAERLLKREDVVVYIKDPKNPDTFLVGRVVALPGERVAVAKGKVLVNGEPLSEQAISVPTEGDVPEILVPRDHYFILVDQRNDASFRENPGSVDSRAFGPISASRLMGKVIL